MKIDQENIEEYILLWLDGELDAASAAEVSAFLERNESCRPLLEAYRAAVLPADKDIVYPGKELLLREEPAVAPFRKRAWPLRRAAAAAVLLLAGGMLHWLLTADRRQEPSPRAAIVLQQKPAIQPVPAYSRPVGRAVATASAGPVKHMPPAKSHNPAPAAAGSVASPDPGREAIDRIPLLEEHIVQEVVPPPAAVALAGDIAPGSSLAGMPEEQRLPEWLPFKEENLQGLNELLSQIRAIRTEVREATQALKGSALVIRLGDKDITLGNKKF